MDDKHADSKNHHGELMLKDISLPAGKAGVCVRIHCDNLHTISKGITIEKVVAAEIENCMFVSEQQIPLLNNKTTGLVLTERTTAGRVVVPPVGPRGGMLMDYTSNNAASDNHKSHQHQGLE